MKKLEATIAKEDRKTSLAAARKAGHLYYWKNGKKMAAVYAEDLGGLSLRDFMNKQLGLTRKDKVKHPPPKQKPRRKLAKPITDRGSLVRPKTKQRSGPIYENPDFSTLTAAQLKALSEKTGKRK